MVHIETYNKAIEFKKLGQSTQSISDELGINKSTLSNWFIGRGVCKYEKKNRREYVGMKIDEGVKISPVEYMSAMASCKNQDELFRTYSYIFGLYLGDGHITNFKRTKCITVTLDSKYENLNNNVISSFKVLFSDVRVVNTKCNAINIKHHDSNLELIFPQNAPGLKCDRKISIENWQAEILDPVELLRGLIMSDGSYYMRKSNGQYEYSFSNCSLDIINITSRCLDILEIQYGLRLLPSKIKNNHDAYKITIASKKAVEKLHEYIGDKINIRNRLDIDFNKTYSNFNNIQSFRRESHRNRVVNTVT